MRNPEVYAAIKALTTETSGGRYCANSSRFMNAIHPKATPNWGSRKASTTPSPKTPPRSRRTGSSPFGPKMEASTTPTIVMTAPTHSIGVRNSLGPNQPVRAKIAAAGMPIPAIGASIASGASAIATFENATSEMKLRNQPMINVLRSARGRSFSVVVERFMMSSATLVMSTEVV